MKKALRSRMLLVSIVFLALPVMDGFYPFTAYGAPAWPVGDITLIVPTQPGGGYDLAARITAPFIEKYLPKRVNVVVKNVPGAGNRVGIREMCVAKPDGLTIVIADVMTPPLMELVGKVEWMDSKKLSWLSAPVNHPAVLLVGPMTGFKQPKDMKGKKVRFGVSSESMILRSVDLSRSIEADPVFVRYNGTPELVLACMRGDLDALIFSWPTAMRQVSATEKKMYPMFVTTRVPGLNYTPVQEFGVQVDEVVMDNTLAMIAPPGLPPEIRSVWEEIFSKVYKDPDWLAKMDKAGYPSDPLEREKLFTRINSLYERVNKYKDVLSEIGSK